MYSVCHCMSLYNPQNIRMPTFQWDSICINAALTHFLPRKECPSPLMNNSNLIFSPSLASDPKRLLNLTSILIPSPPPVPASSTFSYWDPKRQSYRWSYISYRILYLHSWNSSPFSPSSAHPQPHLLTEILQQLLHLLLQQHRAHIAHELRQLRGLSRQVQEVGRVVQRLHLGFFKSREKWEKMGKRWPSWDFEGIKMDDIDGMDDMNDMDGHSFKVWRWKKMETWRGVWCDRQRFEQWSKSFLIMNSSRNMWLHVFSNDNALSENVNLCWTHFVSGCALLIIDLPFGYAMVCLILQIVKAKQKYSIGLL